MQAKRYGSHQDKEKDCDEQGVKGSEKGNQQSLLEASLESEGQHKTANEQTDKNCK